MLRNTDTRCRGSSCFKELTQHPRVTTAGYKGKWFPGQHEAIVPGWLFEKVQDVRLSRAMRKDKPSTKWIHLLASIIVCHDCGGVTYGVTNLHTGRGETENQRRYYYRDSAKQQGRMCPYAGLHIPAALIDEPVIEIVKQLRLPDDWQAQIIEIANYPAELEKVKQLRKNLKNRISRLGDRYELADLDIPKEPEVT